MSSAICAMVMLYSNRLSVVLLAGLLLVACVTRPSPQEAGKFLAFVRVTVVPMDSPRVKVDQTVIVRDGRIEEIGSASKVEVPENAFVVEGNGKYLMPGLADMHVHLEDLDRAGLALFVANGVTTVRNMWGKPEILQWRSDVVDGDLVGPTIYTTGPIIDGDPPMWPGSTVVTTPEQAVSEVAAVKQAGYDGVKVLDNLQPEVYDAVLSAAEEQDLPVYGHVQWRVGLRDAMGAGQKSFEHMTDWMRALLPSDSPARRALLEALEDKQKMSLQSYFVQPFKSADESQIPELVSRALAEDVWFCPTLVVQRKFASTADEFHTLRSSDTMRFVIPSIWAYWDRVEAHLTSDQGDPAVMKEGLDTVLHSVRALHEAGVGLLIGTDTPNPFVVPGFSTHEELQNFVDAGLTPYQALKIATRDAAEFLGALEEFGTVAVGRRADLVLVEANPLEDVGNVARRVGVSVRGRWFPEKDLRVLLDELAKKYAEARSESGAATPEEGADAVPQDSSAAEAKAKAAPEAARNATEAALRDMTTQRQHVVRVSNLEFPAADETLQRQLMKVRGYSHHRGPERVGWFAPAAHPKQLGQVADALGLPVPRPSQQPVAV